MKRKTRRRNLKLSTLLLLIPFFAGIAVIAFTFTDTYQQGLGALGMDRLITTNWEVADNAFQSTQPSYGRKFAYYKVKERQNLQSVASHFSVNPDTVAAQNPGTIAAGATIRVTPVEAPLTPISGTNGLLRQTQVTQEKGAVRVVQDFKSGKVLTDLPELVDFLAPHGVFEKTGPKTYRLLKSVKIEGNIRLDITGETVELLELESRPGNALCLCFEDSEVLIKDTKITSYDPSAKGPDTVHEDERSFVRALNSARMDVLGSTISYLGNGLDVSNNPIQDEGGTYGISWRISKGGLGSEIVTGWVEGSTFYKNHFGSYTFGASGMVWRGNHYLENDVYGLDPHDDSNNALVENNIFERNGKHGFIVSKRCNYNVIRNNVSFGNKLHGYMLHQDSVYNVIEDNVAYDNTDNFAIYASDYNMIRRNRSFNARSNHVRVNAGSLNTFILENEFYGGRRGVFVYGEAHNAYVARNTIQSVDQVIATESAQNVMFVHNTILGPYFRLGTGDRVIFGPNTVAIKITGLPSGVSEVKQSKNDEQETEEL